MMSNLLFLKGELKMSGILDNLLDQDLDAIADLPSYEIPPDGFYKLLITKAEQKTVTIKDNKEAAVLDIGYKVMEVVELSDPTQRSLVENEDGSLKNIEFNETYFFHNDPEKTKSAIKGVFQEVGTALGLKNLGAVVAALPSLEVYATLKHREDKNDKDKVYAKISNVKVA